MVAPLCGLLLQEVASHREARKLSGHPLNPPVRSALLVRETPNSGAGGAGAVAGWLRYRLAQLSLVSCSASRHPSNSLTHSLAFTIFLSLDILCDTFHDFLTSQCDVLDLSALNNVSTFAKSKFFIRIALCHSSFTSRLLALIGFLLFCERS